MIDFCEYEDEEIRMRIPSYLRKKKSNRLFAPSRRGKDKEILVLGVSLGSEEHAKMARRVMADAKFVDWMGVQQRAVRRGAAPYLEDGFELLSTSFNTINGDIFHDYTITFLTGGHYVDVRIFGTGDVDGFYAICTEIVTSISLTQRG